MKNLKETLNATVEAIETLKRQLESYKGSILNCNYVVTVGAYTVNSSWNEKLNERVYDTTLNLLPSLWSLDAVEEMKTKKAFLKEDGTPAEIKYTTKEQWYKQQIATREQMVEMLTKMA